ncbi:arNOG05511 family protein (AAA-type ATPase core domain protein) [Halobacterium hubeiense]|uniref:ArNOG05511 family protein (AAA-type ATPase core domain protein) n=2 Tax=Halobacterium TaxID=2239 RepID=A0A0U5H624_9EURY|nr:ATP-binding protein [Halobacterium hubeiense]CQH61037.1 arNOG05511 family protein (AAA-type ATPase core domain protein) [Halobacterium hubeiense]
MTEALDVVEFLLSARIYDKHRELDENDLPPAYRTALWGDDGVPRPPQTTETAVTEGSGVDEPWDAISGLMFTDRDTFAGSMSLVDDEMAVDWFVENADAERVRDNPVLAYAVGDEFDVDYEAAREDNRSVQADPQWIDGLLSEYFDEDDEEMLDLVEVRSPAEIDVTLDDIVLTEEQENEITKVAKAIEHRDYLATIGLSEIGKLLFVGPPGTGKTSTARGLAHQLDLPFVEVKLSMITSQYLGETAKNVEKVFEVAKRLSPCILFMDEFDFVATTRTGDEHNAIKRAVNTLLKSIDEVSLVNDDVLLIGATNHPDELDAAAWRRFDEILSFPRPDEQMRAEILEIVTRELAVDDLDAEELAAETEGLTGSDLRLVLREAVLDALMEDRRTLTQDDLVEAVSDFEDRDHLRNLDTLEEAIDDPDEPDHEDTAHAGHDHT